MYADTAGAAARRDPTAAGASMAAADVLADTDADGESMQPDDMPGQVGIRLCTMHCMSQSEV